MHYFFLERFLQPADWFEKRLAYTRSVAASSMVRAFYFPVHAYIFNTWILPDLHIAERYLKCRVYGLCPIKIKGTCSTLTHTKRRINSN